MPSTDQSVPTNPTHGYEFAPESAEADEHRALWVSIVGNFWMGSAGIAVAMWSNSQAILVDGLLALIGFAAAIAALWVSRNIARQPDRIRPFGYGADESIFTTFRALTMLGLVLFAVTAALGEIVAYINGTTPTPLNHGPVAVYLGLMLATCTTLWAFHYLAWRKSGKTSDILKLEANATLFDGVITVATGAGLLLIRYFGDGPLAPIVPIGDALIVLILCSLAFFVYVADFRQGLAELAGVAASPSHQATVRQAILPPLTKWGGILLDLAVVKAGRNFSVVAFVDPGRPVSGGDVDALDEEMTLSLRQALGHVDAMVVISEDNAPESRWRHYANT